MAQSWVELLRVADSNSRSEIEKLEEERRKRERLNQKAEKARPVDQAAIQKILERRRCEQEQQKLAEEQRLKKVNELKKQQKANFQIKKQSQAKANSSQATPPPPPPAPRTAPRSAPAKPPAVAKKPAPSIPYEDLMLYAQLKDSKKPLPKELA
ncbi:unnamed protein product, partial [Adineta ricciae]